jgi:hypothetical protein
MDKLLQYSHPAVSKYKLTKYYTLEELQKDGLSLDQIRILFKPLNFEWEKPKAEPKPVKEEVAEEPKRINKSKK